MTSLHGAVAVVTGGASGIGYSLAEALVPHGARLVIADLDRSALAQAVASLTSAGAETMPVPTDVGVREQVEALRDAAFARFGRVDLVFLNAGVAAGGVCWELPERTWQWMIDVNLWGVVHGVRAFLPGMVARNAGHVVITSSTGGLIGSPGMAAYSATKHAVIGLAESLAEDLDLANSAVGVSVLCPGFTRTRMHESARAWPARLGQPPASGLEPGHLLLREAFLRRVQEAVDPEEVAAAALDAIKTKRFWVVPDRSLPDRLRAHLAPVLTP